MGKDAYRIRRLLMADADEVVELLNAVFRPEPPLTDDSYDWKYGSNPASSCGSEYDAWVAESQDGIIGHYGIIPVRLKFGPETMIVGQAADLATHPMCRKHIKYHGIFSKLIERACVESGGKYRFLYCFPSKLAHEGYLGLGWEDLFSVNILLKFLNYDALRFLNYDVLEQSKKQNNDLLTVYGKMVLKSMSTFNRGLSKILSMDVKGSSIEIGNISRFTDEINAFWVSARSNYNIVVERDMDFLNWRFSEHFGKYLLFVGRSTIDKKIVGYAVMRKRKIRMLTTLDITDIQVLSGESRCFLEFVKAAIDLAKTDRVDLIRCWLPRSHRFAKILSSFGFVSLNGIMRRISKYDPRAVFWMPEVSKLVFINGREIGREWFYTLADTDFE